jgi:transposase
VHTGRSGRPRSRPERLLADKAYSHPSTRAALRARGIKTTIPERDDQLARRRARGPGRPYALDAELYKNRNVVERCFNRLKQWRGIATATTRPLATTAAASSWPASSYGAAHESGDSPSQQVVGRLCVVVGEGRFMLAVLQLGLISPAHSSSSRSAQAAASSPSLPEPVRLCGSDQIASGDAAPAHLGQTLSSAPRRCQRPSMHRPTNYPRRCCDRSPTRTPGRTRRFAISGAPD